MSAEIAVDLAFSPRAGAVDVQALRLPEGSRVADALQAGGLAVADGDRPVGIWGRLCTPEQLLRDGDRVELYRPLLIDPKEARRNREHQRQQRDPGGKQLSGSRN